MGKRKFVKKGKRVSVNGVVWYYYPQRKHGRRKKPGPKKKPKPPKPRVYPPWNYIIIRSRENRQSKYIGRYHTIADAYAKKEELAKLNSAVIFPRENVNDGRRDDEIFESKTEYLILKKNDKGASANKLRNEYGKLVDHEVVGGKWLIVDKFPCLEEETFWVYGFDNKKDRKTFSWIFNEFIANKVANPDTVVLIYVYNNKVIFKYDDEDFELVICKCVSDAIRMYNFIQAKTRRFKKRIILLGATGGHSPRGAEIIDMIRKKTGWKYKKIWERSTRH